jgi:parvulin-like peptidyl-prolyl isomerase
MAILGLAFLSACKKQESKSPVLAQVGKATLTLDDLRESFPAEFEQLIRREQYLDFIKRWIDDEAVYQQAKQAKLEDDPAVARKLEKVRRKMLIEEFLARENAAEVFEPDEMAMNQYYEMHKEDFRRKVPEYRYAYIRVQTNKQAAELRSKAQRSDFLAVAAANSLDPAPESYASIAFKKLSEIPPCLAQDIDKAGIGNVTLPVACADGFYLVKVLERQDAGSLIPFPEAKEEISGILILERKDKLLEDRIAKYKEGLTVSYNLDNIPGLSDNGEGAAAQAAANARALPASAPASGTRSAAPAAAHPGAPARSGEASAPAAHAAANPSRPAGVATASAAGAAPAHAPIPSAASAVTTPASAGASAPATAGSAPNPALPREPWENPPPAAPAKPKAKKHARPAAQAPAAPDSGAPANVTSQKNENADAPDTIPAR